MQKSEVQFAAFGDMLAIFVSEILMLIQLTSFEYPTCTIENEASDSVGGMLASQVSRMYKEREKSLV